jgi:hypothetical protein
MKDVEFSEMKVCVNAEIMIEFVIRNSSFVISEVP